MHHSTIRPNFWNRVGRRQGIVWFVALTLVLVACAAEDVQDDEVDAAEDTDDGAADAGAEDRTLIVGAPTTPNTLNGDFMSDPVDFTAHWNLYDQLVGWEVISGNPAEADLSSDVVPRFVEDWTVSDDGLVYEFTLRDDVVSAQGNTLTAEDVRWHWEAGYEREGVGRLLYSVSNISDPSSIEVVDERTVRFTLDQPSAIFLPALTLHTAGIQDSTVLKEHITDEDPYATEWLDGNAAGFGPYSIEEFEPGERVVFVANENHIDGPPPFERVIMRAIPESSNRVALLERGEIDVAMGLSPREYEELRGVDGVQVLSSPGIRATSLRLNTAIEPFDDQRVREAIAHAVPYDEVIEQVYFGRARPMENMYPDALPGYEPQWDIRRDVDRARELLEEAGHPGGLDVGFSYSAAVPEMREIATVLQNSLAEAGIRVTLDEVPAARYTEGLFEQQYGFFIDKDMPLVPDVGYTFQLWFNDSPINYTGYANPEASALIEQLLVTENSPEREQTAAEAAQVIINDVPWIPLAFVEEQVAMREGLEGYTWYPLSVVRWSDLSTAD